jgi:hypothetical protein
LPAWVPATLALAALGIGPAQAQPADAPSPQALRQAYLAFFPMYEMARLRHGLIEDPASPRRQTLNAFTHLRQLADAGARLVTTPNNDTLYSTARLDLRHGPLLVQVPAMPGRYRSLQFINAHTDNLAILGSRPGEEGALQVVVVGPGWTGPLPAHSHRVDADTHDLWLLVRTLVDGPADIAAVAALQDQMRITAPRPAEDYPRQQGAPPREPQPDVFLQVVGEFLGRNPPSGAMAREAAAARPLGLLPAAPGGSGSAALAEPLKAAWQQAWPALVAAPRDPALMSARLVQGWSYPPAEMGAADPDGRHLALRAAVALRGVGALDHQEALYLNARTDAAGAPLDGRHRYRVRIPAGGVPAGAFWSLSMYELQPDGRAFFTPNELRRYAVGNRTPGLKPQADGTIELIVQHQPPAEGSAHWLPAPPGPFALTLRAYRPAPALLRGEAPLPRIERVAE